jgi:hypothetical protein
MVETAKRKPLPFVPASDRLAEMPMEELHLRLDEAAAKLPVPRIANAGRNAFEHLRRAWRLHPVDSNMSLFCAITAEEEAATAVILALQHRGYPQADQLRVSNHPHKSAVWLIIQALQDMAVEKEMSPPKIQLRTAGEPRVEFHIDLAERVPSSDSLWVAPDEPFNFVLSSDYNGPFAVHDFSRELMAIAKASRKGSIFEHIKAEGNLRNRILYACEEGIPGVEFADELIIARRRRVVALIFVTIAIMQTSQHQHFLVQCLDVLVRIVAKYKGEMPSLPSVKPRGPRIVVSDQPDGTKRLSVENEVGGFSFAQTYVSQGQGIWRASLPKLTGLLGER